MQPLEDFLIPTDLPMTPLAFLERAMIVRPDQLAAVDGDRRMTFKEAAAHVTQLAHALTGHGLEPGDRVAYLAPNSMETLWAHFAVPLAGGVLVTINTRLAREEVRYILEHSAAKIVMVDPTLWPIVDAIRDTVPAQAYVVLPDEAGAEVRIEGTRTYREILASGSHDPLPWEVEDEDATITINYTSGTTGRPKGVMYTHRGAYLSSLNQVMHQGFTRDSVYLWTLPMFHCSGWGTGWAVVAAGGVQVCLRGVRGPEIWRLIDSEGITHLCGASTVLTIIAGDPAAHPLTRSFIVTTGGAPPPPTIIEKLNALNVTICHVYGLTETYGPYTVCEPQAAWADLDPVALAVQMARQGVGMIAADRVRVVNTFGDSDDELVDVPADGKSMGEIVMRGNTTMKGYYNDPEATEEAFRGGWFHSGDLGVMHPDGYVQLVDRAKDIIISGGENISTVQVEQAILRNPAVGDVAVVGVPDERWGEVPRAFVVLNGGMDLTEQELITDVRSHLAHFKAPKTVEFVSELPKTSTGKIRKHELRSQAWAGRATLIQG
jgi:fatty-acyl-CoA synthase